MLPTVGVALDITEAHGRTALDAIATVVGDARVLLVLDNLEQVLDAAEDIAAICRRLDGLPLALELAAARARILEPAALLQRLDHALDLLTSGDRDLPLRQRTLRATISWSYSLLDANEQRTLRRCSVFHEGWTLEALERVCFDDAERFRALDELDSLVEKGLVRVVGRGERYTLLETVRAFAAEQLHAGGEVEAVRNAHAAHFLAFSAGIERGIFGTGQRDAVRRALADNANTLTAIEWLSAVARTGDEAALENAPLLAGNLDWYWHIRGLHFTGRTLLRPLLDLAAERPPSRGRARAWLTAGMISTTTGEWERSLDEWTAGHADGAAIGDDALAAEGAMGMGYCGLSLGRMDASRAALDEAIAKSANGVSDFMQAISKTIQGMRLFVTGELDAGMALVRDALAIHERIADNEGGGIAKSFLAQMTFAKGDHERALELYADALTAFETVGDRPEIARVHCETGWTALAGENIPAARKAFRRGVLMNEEVGSPRGTGLALLGLAAVDAAEGRTERAVAIAAAAQAQSDRAGVVIAHPMDPGVVQRIEALQASIPQSTLDGLLAEASALTPAAVLALVANDGDS